MKTNIYESPKSDLSESASRDGVPVYSPNQVFGGSIWGGPLAAVYFLWQNYSRLGMPKYARRTLAIGAIGIVVLMGLLAVIPENVPSMVAPLVYSLIAQQIAAATQLKKYQIKESDLYYFPSNWKVVGIGVVAMVVFLLIAVAAILATEALGLVSLA